MKMYEFFEEDIKAIKHDLMEIYVSAIPRHGAQSDFEDLIEDCFERLHNCTVYDTEEV